MTAQPILELRDVSKLYGGVAAVAKCSFSVKRGSITGLIGPNGAGKTTAFNTIAGRTKPTSGRITLNGQDITGLPAHEMFARGLVRTFQIPHEFSRLTCLENMMLVPRRQSGEDLFKAWFRPGATVKGENALKDKALETLEFLGIAHLKAELAGNLSGGQKKLLELGRTMMTEPELVLLDEPGAGVNRTLLGQIVGMIRKLNEERGYTFCIIEHDMGFIAELCERVICMAEGTVLTQGTMSEVRSDPRVLEAYLGKSGVDSLDAQAAKAGAAAAAGAHP